MRGVERNYKSSIRRAMLGTALLSLIATAALAQQSQKRGQWRLDPFKLIGNIYYVGLSNNTSFLITTPKGLILLDPTLEAAVPDIRKNIEELGFKVSDIKIILQAHAHGDHVGGLAKFKEITGAQVVVMEQDAAVLADGGKSDFRGNEHWTPVKADRIVHDGEKVELGGVSMVAHLTAGHTKGCTTWSTIAQENGKKYNVVFVCSVRMNTGVPLLNNAKYPNIVQDFEHTFATLRALPADVFTFSHGNMFDLEGRIARMKQGGPNPFIDPDGYRRLVAEYEKAFRDQLAKERAGGPPYPVSPPPAPVCPDNGRTCYGSAEAATPAKAGA